MPTASDRRKLAELALAKAGTDLNHVVSRLRADGMGWRKVADRLFEVYGIDVNYTTLQRWFAPTEDMAA